MFSLIGASVASFTPPANDACTSIPALDTGSTTSATITQPNFWTRAGASHLGSTIFDTVASYVNNWNGYGATTVSYPFTPSSSPQWDEVVACFPEGPATTTTTASTTVTSYSPTVTSTSYSPTVTLTTYNATATSYSPTVTSTSIVSTVTSATATSTLYGNVQGYPNIVTFLIIAMVLFGGLFVVLRRRAGKTISTGIERLEG